MNARVTLGVAIPQTFPDGRIDPRRIQDFVQRAETLGFDSAWVVEHTFGSIPALAPIELLTYAAAVTERLRLGAVAGCCRSVSRPRVGAVGGGGGVPRIPRAGTLSG